MHYDNAPSHTAGKVKAHIENSKVNIWDHPAYSPDLAIFDFGLFGTMKESFKGNDFEDEDELLEAIKIFFVSKSEDFYVGDVNVVVVRVTITAILERYSLRRGSGRSHLNCCFWAEGIWSTGT